MNQNQLIKKALFEIVVPKLVDLGFDNKYPMFYKQEGDFLNLIYIGPAKVGNAITVEASYVRLNRSEKESNVLRLFNGKIDEITPSDCDDWYLLKGKHKLFFFTDTYYCGSLGYYGVNKDKAADFKKPFFHIKVKSFHEGIYEEVCNEINSKLPKVFKWLNKKKNECKQ